MTENNTKWIAVKDGDPRAVALYRRHYSCNNPKADLVRFGFSGNGASLILLTLDCRALFCWRYQELYQRDGQQGVNCSIFRNESDYLSSDLIKDACEWAYRKWGFQRLYTYVNPDKVNHKRDPGRCFIRAGWQKLNHKSTKGLILLEKLPPVDTSPAL